MKISDFFRALLQLAVPDRCRVCKAFLIERERPGICDSCFDKIDIITDEGCFCCGRPISGKHIEGQLCGKCLVGDTPWERCLSLVAYDSPVSDLLHRLKYQSDTSVVPAVRSITAEAMAGWRDTEFGKADLVVPVPLHRDRLRSRGLNQAACLARAIFPHETMSSEILVRNRATIPQTGLTGAERRRNLRGAFEVRNRGLVMGKSVWLVDDVFTTGTTVGECSRALKKGGATEIYVVTVARVITGR